MPQWIRVEVYKSSFNDHGSTDWLFQGRKGKVLWNRTLLKSNYIHIWIFHRVSHQHTSETVIHYFGTKIRCIPFKPLFYPDSWMKHTQPYHQETLMIQQNPDKIIFLYSVNTFRQMFFCLQYLQCGLGLHLWCDNYLILKDRDILDWC